MRLLNTSSSVVTGNKHATSRINLFQQLGPIVDGLGININNMQNSNNVRRLTYIIINGHSELQYQDNIMFIQCGTKLHVHREHKTVLINIVFINAYLQLFHELYRIR